MNSAATSPRQRRGGRLSSFKVVLSVNPMKPREYTEAWKTKVRDEIAKLKSAIGDSEVRILLPPANIKHLDLFVEMEEANLRFLREELSRLTDALSRAEGQQMLVLS